ncbi:hypothetical protein V1511DRAFT_505408, partial [Dipodascopsis uninucleata]
MMVHLYIAISSRVFCSASRAHLLIGHCYSCRHKVSSPSTPGSYSDLRERTGSQSLRSIQEFPCIENILRERMNVTTPLPYNVQVQQLQLLYADLENCGSPDELFVWAVKILNLNELDATLFSQKLILLDNATNIVEHQTKSKSAIALYYHGLWHENGEMNTEKSLVEAFKCYKQAARMGFNRALYRIGMIHERRGNYDKAWKRFIQGAELLDAGCMQAVGMIYLQGAESENNKLNLAVNYLRRAAEAADEDVPMAAYIFGQMLSEDEEEYGIDESILAKDPRLARCYIEKAAALGLSHAQVRMAVALQLPNLDCTVDARKSILYYELASKQGNARAHLGLSMWYATGDDMYVAIDETRAFQYANTAATMGYPAAYFTLGYYYEVGIGTKPDVAAAHMLYEEAANESNQDAAYRLSTPGVCFTRADHNKYLFQMRQQQRQLSIHADSKSGLKNGKTRPVSNPFGRTQSSATEDIWKTNAKSSPQLRSQQRSVSHAQTVEEKAIALKRSPQRSHRSAVRKGSLDDLQGVRTSHSVSPIRSENNQRAAKKISYAFPAGSSERSSVNAVPLAKPSASSFSAKDQARKNLPKKLSSSNLHKPSIASIGSSLPSLSSRASTASTPSLASSPTLASHSHANGEKPRVRQFTPPPVPSRLITPPLLRTPTSSTLSFESLTRLSSTSTSSIPYNSPMPSEKIMIPRKKGPKTFEEMNIPQLKEKRSKEGCTIM